MSYQALYRSWRPQTFSDLVGQTHVRQTLTNAIRFGQLAHAYLFTGPRGTGKTSIAKVVAKAVNCEHPDGVEPCNQCAACMSITAGSNVDVEEIDAASNRGVDEIRQLRDQVHYAPATLRKKVYIVDEVHMLTTEAFNALLKTLEEPPSHALFILATTEPHKIPATIISRCQRFDFHRISTELIYERLQKVALDESWTYDQTSLWRIAEAADGGLRDALGLLEQAAAFGSGKVESESVSTVIGSVDPGQLISFVQALVNQDYLRILEQLGTWYEKGKDATRILNDVLQVVRDLFIVKLSSTTPSENIKWLPQYQQVAKDCNTEWLLSVFKSLGEVYTQLRYVEQPRLALEAAVLNLPVVKGINTNPVVEVATPAVPVVEAITPMQPAPARGNDKGRVSRSRKVEVLQELQSKANPEVLQRVLTEWDGILSAVKKQRIQTHAWLMNGRAVLATNDSVVLCFVSRIHRESVMKSEDRQLIERSLSEVLGVSMHILALLQEDWDDFLNKYGIDEQKNNNNKQNVADLAMQIFGEDKVEIRTEE